MDKQRRIQIMLMIGTLLVIFVPILIYNSIRWGYVLSGLSIGTTFIVFPGIPIALVVAFLGPKLGRKIKGIAQQKKSNKKGTNLQMLGFDVEVKLSIFNLVGNLQPSATLNGTVTITNIGTTPTTIWNITVNLHEVWIVPLKKPTWAEARTRVSIPPTASERDQFWRNMIQQVIDNAPESEENREEVDKTSVFRATTPDQQLTLQVNESRNFPFVITLPLTFTPRSPPVLNWHYELVGYTERDESQGWASKHIPLPTVGSQIIGPQTPVSTPLPAGSSSLSVEAGGWACTKCGNVNRAVAKFCDNCGASSLTTCPQCGANLRPGAKFCDSCGTKM